MRNERLAEHVHRFACDFPTSRTQPRTLLVAAMIVWLGAVCGVRQSLPAAPDPTLHGLWAAYQRNYMSPEGYVRDPLRSGQVTSEAQSYALLQAAWLRDLATFERVLKWTNDHLQRKDGLYSWLWEPDNGGRIVDANTATDADTDIALALIIASAEFERPEYEQQARQLVKAIRIGASLPVRDGWLPSAGNWAAAERVINLSYFAPYAYAHFDRLDPGTGWSRAIDIGYQLLQAATDGTPARLPADFLVVGSDGELDVPPPNSFSRAFSYDAIRIAWRIEVDCRLRQDVRACAVHPFVTRLGELWARTGRLVTRYSAAGEPESTDQSLSFYGALLPAFSRFHPEIARAWRISHLADTELAALQSATNRYYDANWVWFGLAAADGLIAARTPAPDGAP